MFNVTKVVSCAKNVVAYRNSADTCLSDIDPDLTGNSNTTHYITDVPGITPEVINDAKPPMYSTLSDYLDKIRETAIIDAVNDVLRKQKNITKSRRLLDNITLAKGAHHFSDKVSKSGRFVGYFIQPVASNSVHVILKQIGVQFDTLNTDLTIYMFETSQDDPIKTTTITNTKKSSLQWFDLTDWICKAQSDSLGTNQQYLIGYFEDDLSGQAVDTQLYCGSCNNDVQRMSGYAHIDGLEVQDDKLNGTKLPDTKSIGTTSSTAGLHLRMVVECDLSEMICDSSSMLAEAIKLRAAKRIFQDFYNTERTNRRADISRDKSLTNVGMIDEELKEVMKSLKMEFTEIDGVCAPCSRKGVRKVTAR